MRFLSRPQARAREAEQKLANLAGEMDKLRADFEVQGRAELVHIEKMAEEAATRIAKDAEDTIAAESARQLVVQLQPDALVLDYRMPPGPNGLELAEDLVGSGAGGRLRIVIYSNYQSPALTSRAQRIGVPFLAKGNLRTLRAAVAS